MTTLSKDFHEQVGEFKSKIGEMGGIDTAPGLKIPDEWLDRISSDDDDPMFVTVDVESGWSRSKLKWSPEIVEQAVKAVNEKRPGGNLGHPLLKDKKSYETEFPEPQVVWLAASSSRTGNGRVKAVFKGYVLKGAPSRQYLKLGLIDGVSMFGDSTLRPIPGGYEVREFDLETIDFSRKGRSGMKSSIKSLTGEQASEGGRVEAKDIAALDESEIRTHAPLLVAEIERKATADLNVTIGEQTAVIEADSPKAKLLDEIKALLKLADGDNPVEKLKNLLASVEEAGIAPIKAYVKELLAKKFKDEGQRNIVTRLVGEMHTDYEGKEFNDDLKKTIEDDLDAKLDGDDDIKAVVGEMTHERRKPIGGEGGTALGGHSSRGDERGRGGLGSKDGIVKQNDRLTVKKVKVGG